MKAGKNVICVLALGLALLGTLCLQPVATAQDPLVPEPCSPEGAWIMTLMTPQGPQIQTLTITPRSNAMEYIAVLELGEQGNSLLSLLPGFDRQSRFVGQVKQAAAETFQMTVLGYGFKENATGSQVRYMSVVSTSDLHCSGLNVMAAKINMATFLADQDADHNGLPDPGERPVVCMSFDAKLEQVPMMQPCETDPVTQLVDVKVGEEFTVTLESNATTGFSWSLVSALPYWLEQTNYEYKPLPAPPGTTGTGGFEEWTYKAKAAGSAMLLYEYRQGWMGDDVPPPARTHSVLVMAQEPGTGQ